MGESKTKAELKEEAERLGVPIESGATKAEIEEALEDANDPNKPDVFVRRFDPEERKEDAKRAMTPIDPPESDVDGPDASAGVGPSVVNAGPVKTGGTTGTTSTTK